MCCLCVANSGARALRVGRRNREWREKEGELERWEKGRESRTRGERVKEREQRERARREHVLCVLDVG
jgi:hypothetical protein